jgi:hypothetical protein
MEHAPMSFGCIYGWLENSTKVDDDKLQEKHDSIDEENWLTDRQPKMRSALASFAMIVSENTQTQELLLIDSKKVDGLLHSFMRN